MTSLVLDFGNKHLRLAVIYNDKTYVLKNVNNLPKFPQVVVQREDKFIIGDEAEANLIGNCNNYFTDFTINILYDEAKEVDYLMIITKVLNHYKRFSEEFARSHFDDINEIKDVILSISYIHDRKDKKWINILKKCSERAGFKNVQVWYEEVNAIKYYAINYIDKQQWPLNLYCVFNLGSLYFYSTVWCIKDRKIEIIDQPRNQILQGGYYFFEKLQNLFDKKLRQTLESKILKPLLIPSYHDFNESFNHETFKNKKYLAECYKKYHPVLEAFSGNKKSMTFEFHNIIEGHEIELEITKDEIYQELDELLNNVKKIIEDTKSILNDNPNAPFHIILIGNGSKFPGVKELFEEEFPGKYQLKGVFCDEEVLKGALL